MSERTATLVVLAWNRWDLTKRCLDSLRGTDLSGASVLVVDNGSTDETPQALEQYRSSVRVIRNPRNLGFVRGNNVAIAESDPDSDVVLLNNDVEFRQVDWLQKLRACAHTTPGAGIVGCRLILPDGRLLHAGTYVVPDTMWGQQIGSLERDVGQHTRTREVEGIVFACAYIRREVIDAIEVARAHGDLSENAEYHAAKERQGQIEATIADLLGARSGVYHEASNSGDNLADAPPRGSQKHGTYFLYSNWDFNALGTIFEQFTGGSIYDALQRELVETLKRKPTYEIARVVAHVRGAWPGVEIWLRADSGFAREALMRWCEDNRVEYVFGLARNARLEAMIAAELAEAKARFAATGQPVRVFKELEYATRDSWSKSRRVVAKAEHLEKGANPRFIVTSLPAAQIPAAELYETIYCQRGEMENRIKECQLDLYADRASAATMGANQLRLWFASLAYLLVEAVRRLGLQGSELAKATAGTIRLKLLKIGAVVTVSVRRIKIAFATACPAKTILALALSRLRRIGMAARL